MNDIDAYGDPEKYILYQLVRPDYCEAITTLLACYKKFTPKKKELLVADFCAGIGSNSKIFAEIANCKCIFLIDTNKDFLAKSRKIGILSKEVHTICADAVHTILDKKCDIALSVFAYHHISDARKQKYLKTIARNLKKGGILYVAEIYLTKKHVNQYYNTVLQAVPSEKQSKDLVAFIQQTAASNDFEFKVPKSFAEPQFIQAGFQKIFEKKMWPLNNFEAQEGMFVQVFKKV